MWPRRDRPVQHVFEPLLCPLLQVTNMARQMVINYGFSDIGPWSLLDQNAQSGDMIMRMMARSGVSESLQHKIDVAVRKIADQAYTTALSHIRDNREVWAVPAWSFCTAVVCNM